MAKARSRNRIVLHLNRRMALEAIILNRLEMIPRPRQQEWLRGLLVQGFRDECLVLRQEKDVAQADDRMKFSGWLMDEAKGRTNERIKQKQEPKVRAKKVNGMTASKPFAELGRIIG